MADPLDLLGRTRARVTRDVWTVPKTFQMHKVVECAVSKAQALFRTARAHEVTAYEARIAVPREPFPAECVSALDGSPSAKRRRTNRATRPANPTNKIKTPAYDAVRDSVEHILEMQSNETKCRYGGHCCFFVCRTFCENQHTREEVIHMKRICGEYKERSRVNRQQAYQWVKTQTMPEENAPEPDKAAQ